ncbi:MAG: hypothetical protein JSU58_01115 [Dehalococcoidales bacterium]|nr:MAG: hypothetical protein JSU58_01115 [Dehalococcoidales bacterium]
MDLTIGIMLAIVGLGMIAFWVVHIVSGKMTAGIKTLENGGFIAFHISAESLTGILCIISGMMLAFSSSFGSSIALFSSGLLAYTSLNSLAWSEIRSKPGLSIMFIVPMIIAIISCCYLIMK